MEVRKPNGTEAVEQAAAVTVTRLARRLAQGSRLGRPDREAARDLSRVALVVRAAGVLGTDERQEVLTFLSLL